MSKEICVDNEKGAGGKMREDQKKQDNGTRTRSVVVAEDEALIRMDIVESLRAAGYDVVADVANGQEAVDAAEKFKPDVVVMDIKMPVRDGVDAARELSEKNIAPVVMLTAFSQKQIVEQASQAGAMAYIVKPFLPEKLFPAIEIAISRFEQVSALKNEVSDLQQRFEVRKKVDRAKGLLMENMGLSESEAFRWIQKTSMDRRLTMAEVADVVISQVNQ
jgi:response regulator NasT